MRWEDKTYLAISPSVTAHPSYYPHTFLYVLFDKSFKLLKILTLLEGMFILSLLSYKGVPLIPLSQTNIRVLTLNKFPVLMIVIFDRFVSSSPVLPVTVPEIFPTVPSLLPPPLLTPTHYHVSC